MGSLSLIPGGSFHILYSYGYNLDLISSALTALASFLSKKENPRDWGKNQIEEIKKRRTRVKIKNLRELKRISLEEKVKQI